MVTDPVMEPASDNFGQLGASSKHFARRLLTIGEKRLEQYHQEPALVQVIETRGNIDKGRCSTGQVSIKVGFYVGI